VFVSIAMIVLYTGASYIADDNVEGAFEWASCSLESFLKNNAFWKTKILFCLYVYMLNVISYVSTFYEEENILKYNVNEWSI